jgi:WD40 repeat protein/DNA-binding SARP family transcriptional activator
LAANRSAGYNASWKFPEPLLIGRNSLKSVIVFEDWCLMLEVRLLGQFEVLKNGVSILIPSRPAQSLLAYLLLNANITHRRGKLAGLLWPNSSQGNARSNLRQALWRVRKALEDNTSEYQPYIFSDQFSIEFNLDSDYWLDVSMLEKQARGIIATDQLMDVLKLYRGELLPGFYDEWVLLERERLQALFERRVEQLLEQLKNEHRWTEMLEWGEHWIAYGQRPEPAYRALMNAYAALGNRSKVKAAFERCVKALRDDLGVEPSEQTVQLYEELVQGPFVFESTATSDPMMPPSGEMSSAGIPPYKGLLYFEETDAKLFFGRDQLTTTLVNRLLQERLLILLGPSGSGKSSIVRAGLVPAIKCNQDIADSSSPLDRGKSQCVHIITPTAKPLELLAFTLSRISESSPTPATFQAILESDPLGFRRSLAQLLPESERFVLIVDQFEELFTLCHDPFEREAFVDHLLSAISAENTANILIVLALRADFYGQCAQYESLRQALVEHQEYLGPMSPEELRLAIEQPAQLNGWELEPGLADMILAEIGDEPGRLPLLSHALLETWNRRSGRTITLQGYIESGGVRGAISHTAEMVYQKLSPDQREIARYIFLQLTELGEDTPDTRRRAERQDLLNQREGAVQNEEVLNILADARLVTISANSVEVAHETLIRSWGRLRTWLDDGRDDLRQRRTLTIMAAEWVNTGRELSYLAVGAQLAKFETLSSASDLMLSDMEQEFLQSSLAEQERVQAQEEARVAREANLEKRSRNVLRALVMVLLLATLVALTLTALAWSQSRVARRNEVAAQGLALTSGAQNAASQGNPELALALALAANQLDPSNVQAQLTLSDLAYAPGNQRRMVEHTGGVKAVVFAPGGKQALSASSDNSLILWDLTSGTPVRRFTGHTGPVTAAAVSPDGKTALSGSTDANLKLWDVENGTMIRSYLGHTAEITTVRISPDGKFALSSSRDQTLILWDLASGEIIHTFSGHTAGVNDADFSPDGTTIVSGSSDNKLILWEVATGERLQEFEGHRGAVTAVSFNPDGKTILSGSLDQVLILWDIASGEAIQQFLGHQDQVNAVSFSPDGKTAISAGGSEEVFNTTLEPVLILWDVSTGKSIQRFDGHSAPVTAVEFSPDGKTALSGSTDQSVILWGLVNNAEIRSFNGHTSAVNSVAFTPDGETALSGSADGSLITWDVSTGKIIQQVPTDTIINSVALSPNGQSALSGGADGRLTLWDTTSGVALRELTAHSGPVTSVSFSPDGQKALSSSSDQTIILWDVTNGQALAQFEGHTNVVNSVAMRGDGKRALSGSYDRTPILWDVETGQIIQRFPVQASVVNAVAFNPDGKTGLAGLADGSITLLDLERGVEIGRLTGHSGPVHGVAFSPDGKTVLSGSTDQSLILWDVASGQPVRRYLGHEDGIRTVAFSPDGRSFLSGALDNSLRFWRNDSPEDLIAWTEANRSIVDLPCGQRAFYDLEPLCESSEATSSPIP